MNRYQRMFEGLAAKQQGAFVPFTMLGDPEAETSLKILRIMVNSGADALELGLPFSDPVADGPVICNAAERALAAGARPETCWQLVAAIRQEFPELPIGLLVYANLVARAGEDAFYDRAAKAGADSVLVADVPSLEAETFCQRARAHGISPVLIAAPNTSAAKLATIARLGAAYTYVVTRSGVTGTDEEIHLVHRELLARLKELNAPPAIMGFGISQPEHVAHALRAGSAGAISGSAIVARISAGLSDPLAMLTEIGAFVTRMKAATARTPDSLRE